ncbi:MAG: hypothetical protein R3268_14610, partial [Acidiferrobacterales bacterium]|nr:hypothetical protein [Acidiferrobacterales bacterium]
MALTGYKSWAVNSAGSIIAGAAVEVRRKADNSLASLFTDAGGGTPLANPFSASADGSFEFYCEPDRYDLLVGSGASQVTVPADIVDGRAQVPWPSRAQAVADIAGGFVAPDGTVKSDGSVLYVASAGATAISDMPGWLPLSGITRTDITANIPTNFPTMQGAIDAYSGVLCAPGSNIIINIESGHELSSGVSVQDGDYSRFVIRSDDAVVNLASSFSGHVFFGERAALPTLDCLIDGSSAASVGHGYYMRLGSSGLVNPGAGIRNLPSTGPAGAETSGVFLTGSSQATADEAVITGNPRNVWVSEASRFDAQNADLSGATSEHLLYASRRAQVHIAFCDLSGAAENAMVLRRS